MAISLTFSHTYNGEEFIELFLDPIVKTEEFLTAYRVMPDVVGKRNIYFRGESEKIVRQHSGSCNSTEKGSVSITDKVIETCDMDTFFGECFTTFDATIFEKEWLKTGTPKSDMTGTPVMDVMEDFIKEGMKRDIPRFLWWASSATATNEDFKTCVDGWFKLMTDSTGSLDQFVDITGVETTGALNTDGAITTMETLITNRSAKFRSVPKASLRWYMSSSAVENYKQTLRDSGTDFGEEITVNGIDMPAFDGIPIIEMVAWDADFADANNPLSSVLNTTGGNIIILAFGDNFIVATDSTNATQGQDALIFYDPKDDKVYARGHFMLGMEIFQLSLIALAA